MTPVTITSPCLFPSLLSSHHPSLSHTKTGKPWDVREMAVACLSSITWALLVSDAAYPEPPLLNHSTMKTDDSDVNVTMYRRAHQAACEAITSALHRRAKDARVDNLVPLMWACTSLSSSKPAKLLPSIAEAFNHRMTMAITAGQKFASSTSSVSAAPAAAAPPPPRRPDALGKRHSERQAPPARLSLVLMAVSWRSVSRLSLTLLVFYTRWPPHKSSRRGAVNRTVAAAVATCARIGRPPARSPLIERPLRSRRSSPSVTAAPCSIRSPSSMGRLYSS